MLIDNCHLKIGEIAELYKKWWFRLDLNQRHAALQAAALPTELQNHQYRYINTSDRY